VTALDLVPPESGDQLWSPVECGTADNLKKVSHETLFLCMPPPESESCADEALTNFAGHHVIYVGEWCSGMTGTRLFHATLMGFELEKRILLPNWPKMRTELFLFSESKKKKGKKGSSKESKGSSQPQPGLLCDVCKLSKLKLWSCPWTRQLCVCSDECFSACKEQHLAVISFAFCGARASKRPNFDEWQPCRWMNKESVSDAQWDDLQASIPQPYLQ